MLTPKIFLFRIEVSFLRPLFAWSRSLYDPYTQQSYKMIDSEHIIEILCITQSFLDIRKSISCDVIPVIGRHSPSLAFCKKHIRGSARFEIELKIILMCPDISAVP